MGSPPRDPVSTHHFFDAARSFVRVSPVVVALTATMACSLGSASPTPPPEETRATQQGLHAPPKPASPNGSLCLGAFECDSGFCVDGVCCNTACGGGAKDDCQVCSAATGAQTNGVCTFVSPGTVCRAA